MSKNYVQLSDSTQWSDAFTEDDYKALVADMFSGKIKVDNSTENKPDVSVEVNYREGTIM
jgi:basic membrane protein A